MRYPAPPAAAAIARHPIHAMLVPFPIVCFTLTLLTDIAYWRSGNLMWANFSAWLLFVGIVVGALAALVGGVDLLARSTLRGLGIAWGHGLGNIDCRPLSRSSEQPRARARRLDERGAARADPFGADGFGDDGDGVARAFDGVPPWNRSEP